MRIEDHQGQLALICDRCQSPVQGAEAVVALHGPDVRLYHGWCADPSDYFLRADADRTLPLPAFIAELAQAAGV
jgi:hypothetical protein